MKDIFSFIIPILLFHICWSYKKPFPYYHSQKVLFAMVKEERRPATYRTDRSPFGSPKLKFERKNQNVTIEKVDEDADETGLENTKSPPPLKSSEKKLSSKIEQTENPLVERLFTSETRLLLSSFRAGQKIKGRIISITT